MKTKSNETRVERTFITDKFWVDSYYNENNLVIKTITSDGNICEYKYNDDNQLNDYSETDSSGNTSSHYKVWYKVINNITFYIGVDVLNFMYEVGKYEKDIEDGEFYYVSIVDHLNLDFSVILEIKKLIDDVKLEINHNLIPQ